jgi:hypothetical protein
MEETNVEGNPQVTGRWFARRCSGHHPWIGDMGDIDLGAASESSRLGDWHIDNLGFGSVHRGYTERHHRPSHSGSASTQAIVAVERKAKLENVKRHFLCHSSLFALWPTASVSLLAYNAHGPGLNFYPF